MAEARAWLDRRYKLFGLADVDLGFAGWKVAADPVHRAVRALRVGDRLGYAEEGGNRVLYDSRVGRARLFAPDVPRMAKRRATI